MIRLSSVTSKFDTPIKKIRRSIVYKANNINPYVITSLRIIK